MTAALQHHAIGISWTEEGGMTRTAHAVASDGRVWLIDPYEDEARPASRGEPWVEPAGVIQLLDRHNRDCAPIASRLGVPHLRLPDSAPDTPFEIVPVISRWGWHEVALWWEDKRALIVAEAIGTAPAFALGGAPGSIRCSG